MNLLPVWRESIFILAEYPRNYKLNALSLSKFNGYCCKMAEMNDNSKCKKFSGEQYFTLLGKNQSSRSLELIIE